MAEIIKLPTTRKAFMEVVREQLATFEKQELAFKARERRERLLRIAHPIHQWATRKLPYLGLEPPVSFDETSGTERGHAFGPCRGEGPRPMMLGAIRGRDDPLAKPLQRDRVKDQMTRLDVSALGSWVLAPLVRRSPRTFFLSTVVICPGIAQSFFACSSHLNSSPYVVAVGKSSWSAAAKTNYGCSRWHLKKDLFGSLPRPV